MNLPSSFLEHMRLLLGDQYLDFEKSYLSAPFRGIRVNLLKCSVEQFKRSFTEIISETPFAPEGFYCGMDRPGRHPWHHAGVFYVQEPSAMSPVTAMKPAPGMKILDLCASPGGKSTQIAARLNGKGLLFCNEVVYPRAKILMSNLERFGVRNAVVTCSEAENLCSRLSGYFDCVLVDAPCSGEGMFRRDPAAAEEWTPESPAACSRRQLALLKSASKALHENGVLIYSTCTFSTEENEGVIDKFLKTCSGFEIERIDAAFGRDALPEKCGASPAVRLSRRVFPMDGGEGHFVARMRKKSGKPFAAHGNFACRCGKEEAAAFRDFFTTQFKSDIYGELHCENGVIYIVPPEIPNLDGINVLRMGVTAGKAEQKRFAPSHSLYMAADAGDAINKVDYGINSKELGKFLHGEEIEASGLSKGYAAVMAGGFITGFGKYSGGVLKNHYPKGLRNF